MGETPNFNNYIDDKYLYDILEEIGLTKELIEEKIYETRDDPETRHRWAELLEEFRSKARDDS